MLDRFERMHIQPFMSHRTIEALDVRVLRWLSWLNIEHRYLILDAPVNHCLANEFRAIVAAYCERFSAPFNDAIQAADDSCAW